MSNNVPTVTNLLSLLDKPPLIKWANKIGLEGISLDEHYNKSKAKGNSYHDQITDLIKHGVAMTDEVLADNFNRFFSDKEILESEKDVSCEFWIGRYDVKFKHNELTYLCDFKSNVKGVYLENKLQLVAYSEIDNVDVLGIVTLPLMELKVVDIPDRRPYVGILRALSHIYKCKNLI